MSPLRRGPWRRGRATLAVVALCASFLSAGVTAHAGDPPAPSAAAAMDEAREAYRQVLAHGADFPEAGPAREAFFREREVLFQRFAAAFAKTDWDAWTLPADKDPLSTGLTVAFGYASAERRFDDARRALDAHVRRLPDDPWSHRAKREFLPDLMMSAADVPGALSYCTEWETRVAGIAKANLCLRLGDLRGATGDAKGRAEAYAAADKAFESWDRKTDLGDRRETYDYAIKRLDEDFKADAFIRSTLLGRSVTTFHVAAWVGPPPVDWGRLRGKVVVMLLCPDLDAVAEASLGGLDAFAKTQTGKPLQVLALVHADGLPGFKASGKQRVPEYLAALREKGKLSVPFAVVPEPEFGDVAFWANHRSVLMIADAKGKVVHAGVAAPGAPATYGIAQFLAEKLAAPAPAPGGDAPK